MAKRKVKKSKRRNPSKSILQLGYEDGKYDWDNDQYFSVGEAYINTVKSILKKEGYSPDLNNIKGYFQGYYYVAFKAGKFPFNEYKKIISQLAEDGLLTEFTKIIFMLHKYGPMTITELDRARNEGREYVEFITQGLSSLGYIKLENNKWTLTTKGIKALSHIVHANKIDNPNNFKDISYFLRNYKSQTLN